MASLGLAVCVQCMLGGHNKSWSSSNFATTDLFTQYAGDTTVWYNKIDRSKKQIHLFPQKVYKSWQSDPVIGMSLSRKREPLTRKSTVTIDADVLAESPRFYGPPPAGSRNFLPGDRHVASYQAMIPPGKCNKNQHNRRTNSAWKSVDPRQGLRVPLPPTQRVTP